MGRDDGRPRKGNGMAFFFSLGLWALAVLWRVSLNYCNGLVCLTACEVSPKMGRRVVGGKVWEEKPARRGSLGAAGSASDRSSNRSWQTSREARIGGRNKMARVARRGKRAQDTGTDSDGRADVERCVRRGRKGT
ncbi:hypothetical protein EV126DRAFT_408452 [Verticillium dahliae]|nr:hypothetical protein EV126DRAFT_408452 [Verticillium dahliae]